MSDPYRDERAGMQARIETLEGENADLRAQVYIKHETKRSARWSMVQRVLKIIALGACGIFCVVAATRCLHRTGTGGYLVVQYADDGRPAYCWSTHKLKKDDDSVSFLREGGKRITVPRRNMRWSPYQRNESVDEAAAKTFRLPKGFCD